MATRLMMWRRRGSLFVIGAALVLSAVPAAAQTGGYGPSVSTDHEDEIALLGATLGSEPFNQYMRAEVRSVALYADARFPNGVEQEPWLGN